MHEKMREGLTDAVTFGVGLFLSVFGVTAGMLAAVAVGYWIARCLGVPLLE